MPEQHQKCEANTKPIALNRHTNAGITHPAIKKHTTDYAGLLNPEQE
jgi:hypothetical protein